jgi:ABC-2 type transport system ATP-binding protein
MRRRLDVLASLIVPPPVLFLDEPTTGLDPRSRAGIWSAIRALAEAGTTILLTTQYLDEADHLASQIVIIDQGRAVAQGTPDALKDTLGSRIDVVVADSHDMPAAAAVVRRLTGNPPSADPAERRLSTPGGRGHRHPARTSPAARRGRRGGRGRQPAPPTLDEVFLDRTGSAAKLAENGAAA